MRLAVLGATGSVGRRALEVAGLLGADVAVVAAGRPSDALASAARSVSAACVAVTGEPTRAFRDALPQGTTLLDGPDALVQAALWPQVDCVVVAVPEIWGLRPTAAALGAGRRVALANKETLVAGGDLIGPLRSKGDLIPVDSEHAAIFQLLGGADLPGGAHLTVTASGGALRDWPLERLASARPEDVLRHPTWVMGPKITVDSATLMNKGLEVIEAHHLFRAPYDAIGVVLHPESVVHGLVTHADGTVLAQMAATDMGIPIARALTWPDLPPAVAGHVDLAALSELHFAPVDPQRHRSLNLAYAVGRMGGIFPAVMSAANDEAVRAFLEGRATFTGMHAMVEETVTKAGSLGSGPVSMDRLLEADRWARERVRRISGEGAGR